MLKGRMKKFEELFEAFKVADERHPSTTEEEMRGPVEVAWANLVAEMKRKAAQGNEHAKRMLAALDEHDEPKSFSFLYLIDEYFREFS